MGLAPLAYLLFTETLRHNPRNPAWPDRDRFVLSAGHASLLLYSVLHLAGYELPLEDIRNFRRWGSKAPGHPERGWTAGVETTTGPLGQGFAAAVGFAVAEALLAARFNRPGREIVDHRTVVVCGDGDMMEGISSEAASLAGNLGLGRLLAFYDDNHISIEGSTDLAFCEKVAHRFEDYGWHVQDLHEDIGLDSIRRAIERADAEVGRPSLILLRTHIGYGSPNKQDSADAHGAPLGEEEVALTKRNLGWPSEEPFFIPPEALSRFRRALDRGDTLEGRARGLSRGIPRAGGRARARPRREASGRLGGSASPLRAWREHLDPRRVGHGPERARAAAPRARRRRRRPRAVDRDLPPRPR
jgi:transketolase